MQAFAMPDSHARQFQSPADDCSVRSTDQLPPSFTKLFDFKYFNVVQSEVFDRAYGGDGNMVPQPDNHDVSTAASELLSCELR